MKEEIEKLEGIITGLPLIRSFGGLDESAERIISEAIQEVINLIIEKEKQP